MQTLPVDVYYLLALEEHSNWIRISYFSGKRFVPKNSLVNVLSCVPQKQPLSWRFACKWFIENMQKNLQGNAGSREGKEKEYSRGVIPWKVLWRLQVHPIEELGRVTYTSVFLLWGQRAGSLARKGQRNIKLQVLSAFSISQQWGSRCPRGPSKQAKEMAIRRNSTQKPGKGPTVALKGS